MKIVGIQFIGPKKIAILDNGDGIELDEINGNASVGISLEVINGIYHTTSAVQEACSS
ncbi:hypothetical protein [Helicovermis profundi]|uniref:Uncharacterized protein n=1 Tax=Helicovermis profundi TaxID=3065157 RepID=A0AAU9EEG1_9FIRM|nr:hypothetical protein HLPR_21550 [Clostridia bacterium S502]